MILLAIESSCDDTGAAVFRDGELVSNVVQSQLIHTAYGGVVPEVASRQHLKAILPVVQEALHQANARPKDLTAIAATRGPGLMGALMVGYGFGKALAASLEIPLINVDHMKAHILAHFIEDPKPAFPFICLTVSGGHTQLVRVNSPSDFELLGSTIDDAAGEAFDKTGKLLDLPYPAGPHIDRLGRQGSAQYSFSKAQVDGLDFSFSGFKTSVLYFLQKRRSEDADFVKKNLEDLCASIQDNIVSVLLAKLKTAAEASGLTRLAVAGGVSANSHLRSELKKMAEANGFETFIPKLAYCTDNAAMIGMAGYFKWLDGDTAPLDQAPDPRLRYATS